MSEIVNTYSFPISGQFQGWPVAESGFELRHPDATVSPHQLTVCETLIFPTIGSHWV